MRQAGRPYVSVVWARGLAAPAGHNGPMVPVGAVLMRRPQELLVP